MVYSKKNQAIEETYGSLIFLPHFDGLVGFSSNQSAPGMIECGAKYAGFTFHRTRLNYCGLLLKLVSGSVVKEIKRPVVA